MSEPPRSLPQRIDADSETVERELFKLVLTIVELVRQLMERQALRRIDQGDLSPEQVEELGLGLMRLEQAMTSLQERSAHCSGNKAKRSPGEFFLLRSVKCPEFENEMDHNGHRTERENWT
jgi:hypothetical protein